MSPPAGEGPPNRPVLRPFPDPLSDAALAATFGVPQVSRDGAGTPVVDVPAPEWLPAAMTARHELGMTFLDWLSAVDQPDAEEPGLDVVLHVMSPSSLRTRGMQRVLLRTRVADGAPLASLTAVWPGVAWHERETFEMFGLEFTGFDDGTGQGLRPLLLPDGFSGTPLRKSFVLTARASKPWPGAKDPGEPADRPQRPERPARPGAPARPARAAPARRKTLPPGVPEPSWGPRSPEGTAG